MEVTATKRSWAVVRSSGTAVGYSEGSVEFGGGNQPVYFDVPKGRSLTRLVSAGRYQVQPSLTSKSTLPTNGRRAVSARSTMSATAALIPVGTLRTQRGKAVRFVRAGHRDCVDHKVRVRLSDSLPRAAKRVTLYVNGKKRTVLTGRELRRSGVTLRQIAPRSLGVIKAVVVRKSGAKNAMRATSWPCR
jgi:hypothetical protein